jgi:hypothetical protein
MDVTKYLDKPYEGLPLEALATQPVTALSGLSESDAQALQKHLGIATIGDLATNRFVLAAQQLMAAMHRADAEEAHPASRSEPIVHPQLQAKERSLPGYALCQYSQDLSNQ